MEMKPNKATKAIVTFLKTAVGFKMKYFEELVMKKYQKY
jgi:hypothetical protein